MHAVKVITKAMLHRKIYSIAILSLLILTNFLLLGYYHPDISIMECLSFSMRLGQVGFSFFIFLTYECLSDISKAEYAETLSTIKYEVTRLIVTQIGILALTLATWTFLILLWQLGCYWNAHVNYFPYIIHMILSIILNCFLPGCIAILIGALLGLSIKRAYAYCLILVFLILMSNIPTKILYSIEINSVPILNYFDWFSIMMPNSNFVADSVYGISIETYRWALALGWISFLAACLLTKMHLPSLSVKRIATFILILIAVIFGTRFRNRLDDSIVRKDYRSDGTLFHEVTYRNNESPGIAKAPLFQISQYDLEITINNKMHVSAILVPDKANLDVYDFTLWHDLEIVDISDTDGRNIPYVRNGDYLTIYPSKEIKKIYINYTGNCGKYFTNYQGIALPGYVPYYPMPGHRNIWDYTNQEINTHQDFSKAHFNISINSNLNVYCNLPEISDNTFAGTAETASIYAGLLTMTTIDNQACCRSPVSYQRKIVAGYKEHWKFLSELVGETQQLDLSKKIIFIQPETIMSTKSSQENLVIYGDHIILGSWALDAESICRNYLFSLIPAHSETHLLEQLFKHHIVFGSNNDYFEKPSLGELMILKKYSLSSDIQAEDEWNKYMSAMDSYENLWNYQISSLGEDTVIKSVYQYLISSDRNQNQIEFLYTLGVN